MIRAACPLALIALLFAAELAHAQPAVIELDVGRREARTLDVEAVRVAIARELGAEVTLARGAPRAAPRLQLRITAARALLVLSRPDGTRMRRSAVLPDDSEERRETIVILAVNMVRDEASELLALLRRRASAPPDAVDPASGSAPTEQATEILETPAGDTTEPSAEAIHPSPEVAALNATAIEPTRDTGLEMTSEGTAIERAATDDASAAASTPPVALGPRVMRIALGGLGGSVPVGTGYEGTLVGGLELAWTPTDFLAFGVRDLGGGASLASNGRWSVGGAAFGELGWILDPALVLHAQIGVDIRGNVFAGDSSIGVAPLLVVGARWFPLRELSIALQTALHVVASGAWSTNLHLLPQGAVLWTGGLSFAVHVS